MPSITVPALPRAWSWTIVTIALVSLALTAPACGQNEVPQGVPDGSHDITDAGNAPDSSAAPDGSAPSDGGANETTVFIDAATDATDAKDATSDGATSTDAGDIDVVSDVASPRDGGTVDAADAVDGVDAVTVDVVDAKDVLLDSAMPDADAGGAPPVPVFSECTFVASVGHVPNAIIDATEDGGGGISPCSCTLLGQVTIYRVLCGRYLPSMPVGYGCGVPVPTGPRTIMILDWYSCPLVPDAGVYGHDNRPLTDWDALLAEQIAGHADGGSDSGATIDGAAD